jgi:hypothetical protein
MAGAYNPDHDYRDFPAAVSNQGVNAAKPGLPARSAAFPD